MHTVAATRARSTVRAERRRRRHRRTAKARIASGATMGRGGRGGEALIVAGGSTRGVISRPGAVRPRDRTRRGPWAVADQGVLAHVGGHAGDGGGLALRRLDRDAEKRLEVEQGGGAAVG